MEVDQDIFDGIVNENLNLKKRINDFQTNTNLVSKASYDDMKKALETFRDRNISLSKQIEAIKKDCIELGEELKQAKQSNNSVAYQNDIDTLTARIKELESKLARQHNGRPRQSTTPDDEIVRLRKQQDKTVKQIHEITGMSTATINRILRKDFISKHIDTKK